MDTAQKRFDATYITSAEICELLSVNRTTVLAARKRGFLPDGILIGDGVICIWERAPLQAYLDAWKLVLAHSGRHKAKGQAEAA